jgi:hypothetical protein
MRERLDWGRIEKETHDNDYAVAFLVLAERAWPHPVRVCQLNDYAVWRPACLSSGASSQ